MTQNSDTNIVIYTPVYRKIWGRLYYLLRSNDRKGAGYVTISWTELLTFFSTDDSTLHRWLEEGQCDGAFRAYTHTDDLLSVFLSGKKAIASALGLRDLGAEMVIDRAELASANWRDRLIPRLMLQRKH